jgi:hypothetical protein
MNAFTTSLIFEDFQNALHVVQTSVNAMADLITPFATTVTNLQTSSTFTEIEALGLDLIYIQNASDTSINAFNIMNGLANILITVPISSISLTVPQLQNLTTQVQTITTTIINSTATLVSATTAFETLT